MAGVDLNTVICNGEKIAKGDHAVGIMSDDLKKLYGLRAAKIKQTRSLTEPLEATLHKKMAEHEELHSKGEIAPGCWG